MTFKKENGTSLRFLRTFYERTFDGPETSASYEGASLEEFLTVARLLHPLLSTEGARSLAPRSLQKQLPKMADVEEPPYPPMHWLKGPAVDLSKVKLRADAEGLLIERARKSCSGASGFPSSRR